MNVPEGLALGIVAVSALIDVRVRRIPNVLTFGGALLALAMRAWLEGWEGIGAGIGGWVVGALLFFPLFALRGLGAGDVKLLAAVGACLGPYQILRAAFFSVLAGGLMALVIASIRGYVRRALYNVWTLLVFWRTAGIQPVPGFTIEDASGPRLAYGAAIAVGTFVAVWLK